MLRNVKIAIFDLDGTLLNNSHEITPNTREILNKLHDSDIKLALASGRIDSYIRKYADDLGVIDYIIADNGALILDHDYNILYEETFNYDTLIKLWEYALNNGIGMTINALNERYSNTLATTSKDNNIIVDDITHLNKSIYQVVFSSTNHNKIEKLLTYLELYNEKISYISKHFYDKESKESVSIDLNLENTSKGNGIEYLLKRLNYTKDNALCFGDGDNDISMFNKCGNTVAMENSNMHIKSIADYITLDNNSDGIYDFINKNMDL
jgi:hypothetical protein